MPVTLLAISLAILSDWWKAYHARAAVLTAISLAIVFSMLEKTSIVRSPAFPTIEYITKQGIHGETILISDWPGAVAFYTDNNVVAADMLTSNRFDFDQMRAASNALDYLLSECKRRGKPIERILMVGSNWLEWDDKTEEITYFDPRRFPVLIPIGKLKASHTPAGELQTADGIKVWLSPSHNSHDATNIRVPAEAAPAKRD